jgi:hypothetical protein
MAYTQAVFQAGGGAKLSNNDKIQTIFEQADELLRLCKGLDYEAIVAHQPAAVEALQDAVRVLKQSLPRNDEGLNNYAQRQQGPTAAAPQPAESKDALLERRRRFVEAFSHAGLGDRLGKLYCTETDRRQVAFREAPHKLGLPQFDMVVGPDFTPTAGYHGIFISNQEVMSCVLPSPANAHQWQVRERHRFADIEQVVDLVSMLSAGFPVG